VRTHKYPPTLIQKPFRLCEVDQIKLHERIRKQNKYSQSSDSKRSDKYGQEGSNEKRLGLRSEYSEEEESYEAEEWRRSTMQSLSRNAVT
jgi:hypothetical protein